MSTNFTGPRWRSQRRNGQPQQKVDRQLLTDVLALPDLRHRQNVGTVARDVSRPHESAGQHLHHLQQIFLTTVPLVLIDCLSLSASLILGFYSARFCFGSIESGIFNPVWMSGTLTTFLIVYALRGLYPGIGLNPVVELRQFTTGSIAAGILLAVGLASMGRLRTEEMVFLSAAVGAALFLNPVLRFLSRGVLSRYSWWGYRAVVVGSAGRAQEVLERLKSCPDRGLKPIGIISGATEEGFHHPTVFGTLGGLKDIAAVASEHHIFWAIIAAEQQTAPALTSALLNLQAIPNVVIAPELHETPSLWSGVNDYGGVLGIHIRERLLSPSSQCGKRIFDIAAVLVGGMLLLPLLLPLLLCIGLIIRWHSPGPLLFGQERIGKDGRRFLAWKIRTMVMDAENVLSEFLNNDPQLRQQWEIKQKLVRDPRVIPWVGNFLRKSSLDELPQLWNVLLGEMSLVGPRPFIPEQTRMYGDAIRLYAKVRPGITGLWQISGRNCTSFEERVQYDVYYIRNWSLWLDLFILGRTVKTVLLREGAF